MLGINLNKKFFEKELYSIINNIKSVLSIIKRKFSKNK